VAQINLGSVTITSSRAIRYLELLIGTGLSYRAHMEHDAKKAAAIGQALNRIMLNTRRPKQGRRLLLQNVVKATKLYRTPIWAHATSIKSYMTAVNM